jgi:hypothetical protein
VEEPSELVLRPTPTASKTVNTVVVAGAPVPLKVVSTFTVLDKSPAGFDVVVVSVAVTVPVVFWKDTTVLSSPCVTVVTSG